MSTTTPNLGLVKPATSETYDIDIQNANNDKVDAFSATVVPKVVPVADGNLPTLTVTGGLQDSKKKVSDLQLAFPGLTVLAPEDIVDADSLSIYDASVPIAKKTLVGSIKAFLKIYFDSLYAASTHTSIAASETAKGHVELATAAETTLGTDDTRAVHPAGLKVELDKKIKHSLATATNDFLVASGAGAFVKKTLAEVKTILGLGSAAYTESSAYAAATHGHAQSDITGLTTALANLQSLIFKNKTVAVAAWNADAEFPGWGYRASIACTGALATMVPTVNFAPTEIAANNYASFSISHDGGVYIYARSLPATNITISNIVFIKVVA